MRLILAGMIAIAFTGSAAAQDRVIGLLSLPEVYGSRMCAPFEPGQVALHATLRTGPPTAFIRVDQNWSFAPHGGCEGLKVSVQEGARHELPTLEFDYEMRGAIVAQRERWFRIVGTGWMPQHAADGEPTIWFSSRGCQVLQILHPLSIF